ncbi:MAG: hypothetical protein ILP02_04965 [Clostridia bacterium]|nr:hypothetical protein [Clostridia bacterium]
MTDEITDVYTHGGTLDLETGKAENRVENIYFTVKQGTFYKISEAYQLGMNVDFYGDYEITADLDFSTDAWPAAFAFNEFKGKMYSTPGHVYKIINPTATFISEDSEYGGLFGALTDASTVKDLVFENVTVRYEKCALRLRTAYFGVFAGYIDSDAAVENVTLSGTATLRLDGALPFERPTNENLISLSANGAAVKITDLSVPKVVVGGTRRGAKYRYGFDPETMVLSADGTITLHFDTYDLDEAEYEATLTPAAE